MKVKAIITEKQEKAFFKAIKAIEAAKKTGLEFYGMQYRLTAYTTEAAGYVRDKGIDTLLRSKGKHIPYISASVLSDSGADDYARFLTSDEAI